MTFDELIERLLHKNIQITLEIKDGVRWYNLNTGMKSDLCIAEKDDTEIRYETRYFINGIEELTWNAVMKLAYSCMRGREYMQHSWQTLLTEEGLLKQSTKGKI